MDQIVDELAEFPTVHACYQKWAELQHQVESYYKETPMKIVPLSQQKEFRSIKNAIIREAERIRMGQLSFEDGAAMLGEEDELHLLNNELHDMWMITQNRMFGLAYRQNVMAELEDHAKTGNAYAQYCMGKLYRDGGIVIPDTEIAKAWLEKAAAQNFSAAQYALAELLISNDPTVRDHEKGWRMMEAAAENGNSAAQYRMGKEALREGRQGEAMVWFMQAADQDNQYAQYMLGKQFLLWGQEETALAYFSMAAAQGNSYAQYFLDRQDQLRSPSVMLATTRLFRSLSKLFQSNAQKQIAPSLHIDQKRRRELMMKRQALGIRGPVQDETYSQSM